MVNVRRFAPAVYAVIAIVLLVVASTEVFLVWLIVGAVLVGLLYATTRPVQGRQRNRNRR